MARQLPGYTPRYNVGEKHRRRKEPQNHGTTEPRNHGTTEPQNHGTTEPRNRQQKIIAYRTRSEDACKVDNPASNIIEQTGRSESVLAGHNQRSLRPKAEPERITGVWGGTPIRLKIRNHSVFFLALPPPHPLTPTLSHEGRGALECGKLLNLGLPLLPLWEKGAGG